MFNKDVTYTGFLKLMLLICCGFVFSCKESNNNVKASGEDSISSMTSASDGNLVMADVDTASVAKNKLNWSGKYRGELFCSDCHGIQTELMLHRDSSFELHMSYEGKNAEPLNVNGKLKWSAGNIIELSSAKTTLRFLVEKGKLIQIDASGNKEGGESAGKYMLLKD